MFRKIERESSIVSTYMSPELKDHIQFYESRMDSMVRVYGLSELWDYFKIHNRSKFYLSYHGKLHVEVLCSNFMDYIDSKDWPVSKEYIRSFLCALIIHDFNYIGTGNDDANIEEAIRAYMVFRDRFPFNISHVCELVRCTRFPFNYVPSEEIFNNTIGNTLLIQALDHSMFLDPLVYSHLVRLLYLNEMRIPKDNWESSFRGFFPMIKPGIDEFIKEYEKFDIDNFIQLLID